MSPARILLGGPTDTTGAEATAKDETIAAMAAMWAPVADFLTPPLPANFVGEFLSTGG